MKAKDILTSVVVMLAQMGSTMKFVVVGEGDIEDDLVVKPYDRYTPPKWKVSHNSDCQQEEDDWNA